MRKVISITLATSFAVLAIACAPMAKKGEISIKCPACGTEFNVPAEGGNGD